MQVIPAVIARQQRGRVGRIPDCCIEIDDGDRRIRANPGIHRLAFRFALIGVIERAGKWRQRCDADMNPLRKCRGDGVLPALDLGIVEFLDTPAFQAVCRGLRERLQRNAS